MDSTEYFLHVKQKHFIYFLFWYLCHVDISLIEIHSFNWLAEKPRNQEKWRQRKKECPIPSVVHSHFPTCLELSLDWSQELRLQSRSTSWWQEPNCLKKCNDFSWCPWNGHRISVRIWKSNPRTLHCALTTNLNMRQHTALPGEHFLKSSSLYSRNRNTNPKGCISLVCCLKGCWMEIL